MTAVYEQQAPAQPRRPLVLAHETGAPTCLAPFELGCQMIPGRGSGDAAKLGERYEDDAGGGVERGCGDLDHRGVAAAHFEDAAARAGWRVVDRLEQLGAVEGGDLSRHGNGLMLGAGVGGHEPRGGVRRTAGEIDDRAATVRQREAAVGASAVRRRIHPTYRTKRPEGERRAVQNGVAVAVLATVIDVDGRSVELTEERWAHIVGAEPDRAGHPELVQHLDAVLRAVQAPDHRLPGRRDGEEWCYLEGAGPSRFLKVVVAYDGRAGRIKTAFGRRSMP
jgi:hypothetical protein